MQVVVTGGAGFHRAPARSSIAAAGHVARAGWPAAVHRADHDRRCGRRRRSDRSARRARRRRHLGRRRRQRRHHGRHVVDFSPGRGRERHGRGGLRPRDADQRGRVAADSRSLPPRRSWAAAGLRELGGGLRRRAVGHDAGLDRADAANVVRHAEGDGRAPDQRLQPSRLRGRAGAAAAHDQRSARPPERGGLFVRQRHHPRTVERRAGGLSGGSRDDACCCCRRPASSAA